MSTPAKIALWAIAIVLLVLIALAIDGSVNGEKYRKAEAERVYRDLCARRGGCPEGDTKP